MARVLIVDDDFQVREMLTIMLKRAGHEVAEAGNGNEAIQVCQDKAIDLVITDIIMPDKEGIETIVELRRDYPDIKIFAISGGGRVSPENYLKLAEKIGALKTFAKPFSKNQILSAIDEALAT